MKTNISLFDTLQQIRSQQHNRQQSLLASYQQKDKSKEPVTTPGKTPAEPAKPVQTHADFSQMSARQLGQWLQQGLKSGKIAPEQEAVFKTLIYSATAGDANNSDKAFNFSEKAQQGIQSAIRRKDSSAMLFWGNAVQSMKKYQGEKLPQPTA